MEIEQSRTSYRIRYQFGEDELKYSLEDGSGGRYFSVQYTDISRRNLDLLGPRRCSGGAVIRKQANQSFIYIVSIRGHECLLTKKSTS